MRYKPEWKGNHKVDSYGEVYWKGISIGKITSRTQEGATSPKGMVTNTVFTTDGKDFQSMTQALEHLIGKA